LQRDVCFQHRHERCRGTGHCRGERVERRWLLGVAQPERRSSGQDAVPELGSRGDDGTGRPAAGYQKRFELVGSEFDDMVGVIEGALAG